MLSILKIRLIYPNIRQLYKNKLKSAIRSAKLDYLRSLLCRARHTPRFAADLWSEINDTVGCPKKPAPVLDSRLSLDDINRFFRTVAVSADHRSADYFISPPSPCGMQLFQFEPVDSCVVLSLLTKLDTRKSTGPNDLSALFLQRVAECIAVPFSDINL